MARRPGPSPRTASGSGWAWAAELTDLVVGFGMDSFVFWAEGDQERQLHLFAEEVVPEVRRQVAMERRG